MDRKVQVKGENGLFKYIVVGVLIIIQGNSTIQFHICDDDPSLLLLGITKQPNKFSESLLRTGGCKERGYSWKKGDLKLFLE